jgi:thiol:disulfide interchange protein DsbD
VFFFQQITNAGILIYMRSVTLLFATLWLAVNAFAQPKAHTSIDLLLPVESARPGETVLAGIRLRMEPKWHTYWKNAGESGSPTEIEWQIPAGVTAGDVRWPTPERLEAEGLSTFVLEGEAVLLVPLKLASDLKPGPLDLKAKVSWLECEEMCIPGEGTVSAKLTIGGESKPSANAAAIEAAQAKLPRPGEGLGLKAAWQGPAADKTRALVVEWPAKDGATDPDFFPFASEAYEVQLKHERLPVDASRLSLRVMVKSDSGKWPEKIPGLVVQKIGGKMQAFEASLTPGPSGTAASSSTSSSSKPAESAAGAPPAKEATSLPPLGLLLAKLLAAFGGGIILNLMPCVLPILSLKVLSLVKQSGQEASVARQHSLIYLLGVLVSFWIIAALVMVGTLGAWGAQFQDARFVVAITVLMTLIALNLFGVFEFVLPGSAVNSASQLASREGASGAFFNGVLAVVLGASCVAPLMAPAIGWAITESPLVIALVFTAIGLGLAVPYVAVTFFPAIRGFLPKPGGWMEKFKVALGFPMLAMAAWSFSIIPVHHGQRGALWVGIFLVALAMAAWVYGEFIQRGSRRKGLAWLVVLACLGGGYGFALEHKLDWRHPADPTAANPSAPSHEPGGIAWQTWTTTAVAQARAAGRPVLVDFTADWCLTCQANKASSLEIASVRTKLKDLNAVALIGDYTRKNPAITDELKRFERAGVPLVIVFPKNPTADPIVLPTVLTPGIVLEALDKAAK